MPDYLRTYFKLKKPLLYTFPWGSGAVVFYRGFWVALACVEDCTHEWLTDLVSKPDFYLVSYTCLLFRFVTLEPNVNSFDLLYMSAALGCMA